MDLDVLLMHQKRHTSFQPAFVYRLFAILLYSTLMWIHDALAEDFLTRSNESNAYFEERRAGNIEAHWYEPPNPLGLEFFTSKELSWMPVDGIGLRYTGPLRAPFADQLKTVLLNSPQKYNHVILELDSDGGDLKYVKELVGVLKEAASRVELTTRVTEGSLCASGCIPLFLQGKRRIASGSSIWIFHGARGAFTNLPDPTATDEYLSILSEAGMTPEFRSTLEDNNRIYKPGSFIFSGYELFAVQKAEIINELLPTWREESPVLPAGGIGPH